MSRLAARLVSPLILSLLAGSAAWSEAVTPVAAPGSDTPAVQASIAAEPDSVGQNLVETGTSPLGAAIGTPPQLRPTLNQMLRGKAAPHPRRAAGFRLAQVPAEEAAGSEEPVNAPPASNSPRLEISGFVDFYYEYNFNRPPRFVDDGAGNTIPNFPQNELRNFDFKHNEFALNLAEVVIERAPAPVGFRIDLNFGRATDWVHAGEPGGVETYKHIQQAYLTVPTKWWGPGDTLDVGKFVTHHGAEVIETKDNWNYTRSLLFAWAIPYYHMGLRYQHAFTPTSGVTLHLVNGWNNVEDNNNTPSFGLLYNTAIGKKLTLVQNYMGGPELTNDNRNWRHLFDTVLTYNATEKLTFMLNADYTTETRDNGSIWWAGVAGYARYALSDRRAVAFRAEWFKDARGASTGTAQEVKEVTLTYELKGPGGLLTRAEFRHDWSNKAVFDDRDGQRDNQTTLLLGAIYAF